MVQLKTTLKKTYHKNTECVSVIMFSYWYLFEKMWNSSISKNLSPDERIRNTFLRIARKISSVLPLWSSYRLHGQKPHATQPMATPACLLSVWEVNVMNKHGKSAACLWSQAFSMLHISEPFLSIQFICSLVHFRKWGFLNCLPGKVFA